MNSRIYLRITVPLRHDVNNVVAENNKNNQKKNIDFRYLFYTVVFKARFRVMFL